MKTISALFIALTTSVVLNAAPSLIGSTATVNYLYPNSTAVFGTSSVVVGPGVEISCPGASGGTGVCPAFVEAATIDLGATSIIVHELAGTSYSSSSFNGLQFTGLNFGPGYSLTGFTLTTDLAGLVPADVSFTNNSIEYNAEGLSFNTAPYTIRLDLTTTASTPEPASVALFGLASLALGLWKVRTRTLTS